VRSGEYLNIKLGGTAVLVKRFFFYYVEKIRQQYRLILVNIGLVSIIKSRI
jgi:hypothetical protein